MNYTGKTSLKPHCDPANQRAIPVISNNLLDLHSHAVRLNGSYSISNTSIESFNRKFGCPEDAWVGIFPQKIYTRVVHFLLSWFDFEHSWSRGVAEKTYHRSESGVW